MRRAIISAICQRRLPVATFRKCIGHANSFYATSFSASTIGGSLKSRNHRISKKIQEKEDVNLTYRFVCDRIRSGGPISVHEFMQICAGGAAGYYSRQTEIFGTHGDFVTAPELSQLFGESIALWIVAELEVTSHTGPWQLVELGAGSGTLMHDVLLTLANLRINNFSAHIVETSDALARRQKHKLHARSDTKNARKFREFSCSSHNKFNSESTYSNGTNENTTNNLPPETLFAFQGTPISWHRSIEDVPEMFSIFIANEFLDALPIYQFRRVAKTPTVVQDSTTTKGNMQSNESVASSFDSGQWREVYVNLDAQDQLCLMLSKSENLHTKGLIPEHIRNDPNRTHWEVCPAAADILGRIVQRFTERGGFALFIDYGHNGERATPSLRAYRKHAVVDFLERDAAGLVDLTADVDFGHLRAVLESRCLVFGPVPQRKFLLELGIIQRLQMLLVKCKSDQERDYLHSSFKFLMSDSNASLKSYFGSEHFDSVTKSVPASLAQTTTSTGHLTESSNNGMGTAFKAFALFPKTLAGILERRGGTPIGFYSCHKH